MISSYWIWMTENIEIIFGLPWLRKYEPCINWQHQAVTMPVSWSSDGQLINVLERPQACGCPTSECDGLTCGTVASTTAQDINVVSHYTEEQASDDCAEAQVASKTRHSKRSSGQGHGFTLGGRNPVPVAQRGQHDEPRSTGESIVKISR